MQKVTVSLTPRFSEVCVEHSENFNGFNRFHQPNYRSSDGEIKNQKRPKDPYFKAFQTFSKKEFTRPCLAQKPIRLNPTISDQIRLTFPGLVRARRR